MIKFFCDKCQKEIVDTTQIGNLKATEKVFSLANTQSSNQQQAQYKTLDYYFCIDCVRKIVAFFQKPEVKKEGK